MCIDFVIAETHCCAIGIIRDEYSDEDERPSITAAAREIRRRIAEQRGRQWPYSVIIATVSSRDEVAPQEWWKKVYRKAGFKQFGKSLLNPNSGNIVTKFYIDVPEDFKA